MSNWRDQLKKQTGKSGGSSAPTWREQLKKQSAGETAPVTSSAKNSSITELRDRYERTTGQELVPDRKAPVTGGISEGSEYRRGSVSDLRENFGRFEQEQPEAAAILKRLAEERAAREQKEQRSADMLFGVGAIRTPDGLQKRMEAQLMAEVPGGMSPFTSVDMDLAKRSAMQRAINARANSMPHSVDTEYSIVEGAALDNDKIAAFEQMLSVPASASEEELNLWEKIKGRPEAQSDATRLALASYAANVGEAAASVEEASPLRRAEDLPAVFGAQVDDFRANTVDKLAEEVQANIARGTYSEIENQLTDVSIRMGLDALTMLATGGGSAGVQAAGGMSFVTNMARNPMFWTSFVQEYGSLYDEMTENGTDPQKAASVAAMAAAANSALEVGGGTEKMVGHLTGRLPAKKGWDLAKTIVQGGAEEALEETIQNPVSNLAAKMTYDPYRKVIDPEEIAKNAGMAFLVGGILGGAGYGGQAAVEKVGDAVYRRAETGLIGEMARETDGGAGMIRAAKESDIPELMELANEYEAQLRRGKALSDRQLAELYRAEGSLDLIPKGATTEATTEEDQRTNVRASEPLYGSGEEFAAEEEKTAPAPRGVELSKAETNISSVRRADEAVKSFAQSLGEHGKAAFLAAEEVSGEADGGRFAWQTYYNAGKWGKDMAWADQQNPAARALLVGDLTAEQAFKAGQMDAAEEMQSRAKKVSQKGPGLVLGSGTAHVAPEVRSALDSIAKAFDAQIELMDMGDSQVRGAYNPSTGTIQLNTRTGFQGVMINVAKHEITHKLQDEAPEEYAAFKNYAASVIYERDGIAFEDLVQEQIDLYAERGIQISRSEAEDEVVANATEAFLRDEESIRKLCEKDRSLGQKILDAIRDVIRKIQKVLKGGELEQEAARLLSEDVESLKKAEELWLKALAETKSANEKASSQESEKAVRYQLVGYSDRQRENWTSSKNIIIYEDDVQFRDFIRAALAKENLGKKLYFGMIPEELAARIQQETGLNVEDFNFTLRADEVRKILLRSHGNDTKEAKRGQRAVTEEDILMIPEIIQNPDQVSLSEELYEGKPVIHFVKTVNGRTTVVAYVSKKHFDLTVQTMYAGRKKESLATAGNAPFDTAPTQTPEAHIGTALNDSIRESGKSVKGAEEISDPVTAAVEEDQMGILPGAEMEGGHLRYGIEETMKGVDSEAGKGYDEGVRYSLSTKKPEMGEPVRWAVENGIITEEERVRFYRKIAEIRKQGYYAPRTRDGGYIIDLGNRLAFTDGDWDNPSLDVVIEFGGLEDETDLQTAKEVIYLGEKYRQTNSEARDLIALVGGKGTVIWSYKRDFVSDGRYDKRPEGSVRSKNSEGTGRQREWHFDEDDRYQLTPEARERGRLIRENERLKKANAHLREGFKLTKGVEVSEADVEALAKKILKRYSSDADAGMLAEALRKVYRYIGNDVEPNWETVNEVLSAAAGKVLEDSREFDRSLWEETAELRARIRETPVYVDEAMRSEFALADGYQAFKRSHSRMFKIVNDPNAMSVDQLYTELAEDYPFMLDGEAVSAYDQLQEIADFIEASKPRWQNPFGENLEEMTAELVGEMYDAYFDLPQVKTFADKKQAEIDRMRMKHRAAMRELKEAETLKREELLETVKERYERRIGEMKDSAKAREARLEYEKWWGVQAEKIAAREAREKARDRRFISEHRRKIERKVKALSQALLSPTDMKHVPEGLRNAVKNLVGALDMTGARGEDTNVSKAWAELQAAVVAARADTNSCVTLDPDLEMRIGEIVQSRMSLNEMSRSQAEDLYRVLAALEKACREVRIELKNGRTMAATEVARGIIDDTAGMKRYPEGTVVGRAVRTFFDYDLADPVRFAERFGSHMQDLMQMLRDGHDVQTRRWNEALDYSEEMFRKAQVWKWQEAKATEFELASGEKISLNPARVMELYLLSRREQALSHIYAGGITTKEYTQGGKIVPSERVQVTVNDVAMIIQSLTDEQKQVADRMGHFLSHQASEWGNEVSMELYGYRKFTEKNYWPISSDRNYTVSQMDGNVKDGTLAGLGMTKQTVKNATNPIMIGDAFETYAKHLTQMAAYSAFVPRLEQAKLVINWKTSHDGNLRSAKEALFRVGGVEAVGDERHEGYLQKFIVDLNGRGRVERAPTERFIGASKAAAIAGNVRVVVQQPTAYLRAAAEIDPKYLVQGLRGKRDAEEMKTYAPIARWKDWGFFEPGSGKQLSSLMIGEHGAMKAMSDIAMKPAGMMDNLTWGTLWNAVKAEVEATTDLEPGSEEYLQECGQRFSDVVDRTQVVDSVFHRTQAMRSGSVLVKMSTAFMAEPMKSLNMITGEIHKVMQANGRDAKAAAAKGLCRNATAFMASAILNAVVVAFVDAARDDDDDETYWQKYRQALFGEYEAEMSFRDRAKAFLSADLTENLNPMSMIPYVKDAVSLYQGYDIQRTDVQSFAELSEDLLKWGKLLNGESKYTAAYLTKETASSLSKVFGLPVSNIIRDVMSLVNLGLTIADGQGANTTRLRYMLAKGSLDMAHSSNKNTFVSFMLEARMAGDTELATRIFNDMIEAGWKNDELESAMTTRAKKLLEDQADVLDAYNAAEERADAAGMEAAADELLELGFTSAEIVKAAKSRKNSLEPEEEEEAGEQISEDFWDDYGSEGASFDTGFLVTALVNGDQASAKEAETQLRAAGKTQKEIDSDAASELKERIVQSMGYEKISELPEGMYLDMNTKEYRILHDRYGKTQFSFGDAALAYTGAVSIGYSQVVNDMIGMKYSTSAGEKVYTKDLIREKVTEKILDWYKKGRYDGSASREELTRWKNALDNLGISGEELEEKYRKYEKGKK